MRATSAPRTATKGGEVSATTLSVVAPPGSGTEDVTVTTLGGTSATTTNDEYTYLTPAITNFKPTSGPVGTKVTITGTNLSGATKVTFNGKPATIVSDTATQIDNGVNHATHGPQTRLNPKMALPTTPQSW